MSHADFYAEHGYVHARGVRNPVYWQRRPSFQLRPG
jgi:hypothetical protein